MLNNSRLRVLRDKEDRIEVVLEETRKQLHSITEQPDQYRALLEKLLLQGLLQLIENVSSSTTLLRGGSITLKIQASAIPHQNLGSTASVIHRTSSSVAARMMCPSSTKSKAEFCSSILKKLARIATSQLTQTAS